MKTKEQMAEEYINEEYAKDKWSEYQRKFAEKDYLAGFDARDAELSKMPEFDEVSSAMDFESLIAERRKERPDYANDLELRFIHSWYRNGRKDQFQECAKIIAARDLRASYLEATVTRYSDDIEEKHGKILELEKANADCISLFLHEERMKAQADEIEKLKDDLSIADDLRISWETDLAEKENLQAERDIYLKALEITTADHFGNIAGNCNCGLCKAIIEGKKLR